MRTAVVSAFAGIVVGLVCGIVFFDQTEEDSVPDASSAAPEHRARTEQASQFTGDGQDRESADRLRIPDPGERTREDPALFSKALLEHFRVTYVQAWCEQCADSPGESDIAAGERRFREAVLALPAELAYLDAEMHNGILAVRQAAELGEGCTLLELAREGFYESEYEDRTWEAIDRSVKRRKSGSTVDGSRFFSDKDAKLTEGMTITFGPGLHVLDQRQLRGEDDLTFPSDVTISGAGINATLLRLGNFSASGNVERFTFRDLTIDANDNGLFDLRSGCLVLDLGNVRIVRFDAGHGGCDIFGVREGSLIQAVNCEIIGGYGQSPGSGYLFEGSPVIGSFTDCRLELLDLTFREVSPAGRLLFQNCIFALLEEDPLENNAPGVFFSGCLVESLLEPGTPKSDLRKDLGDLFWQVRDR